MKATEIKNGDDLSTYLKELDAEREAGTLTVKGFKDEIAKVYAKIEEDAKKADEAFKGITVIAKGKWRETEPEKALAEGIGRFVWALRRRDTKSLQAMGALPNVVHALNEWEADEWVIGSDGKKTVGTALRGDATTGSYLIPAEYAREVLRIAYSASAMAPLVRNVPMTARTVYWPSELATLTYSWPTDESTAKTEKSPTFSQKTLSAKTAAGFITITEEINEDAVIDLGTYFRDVFGNAWGYEFDTQVMAANAAPFTGVLYDSGVNVITLDSGMTTVAQATCAHLKKLIASLTTQAKRVGARFIMHPTVFDAFCSERDANGQYIVQRPGEGAPAMIFGYPYTLCDAMPDATTAGASKGFVAFGNPQYLIHGDLRGFEFRVYDQTVDNMQYDKIFLRARLRQAFLVGLPAGFGVLKTAAA